MSNVTEHPTADRPRWFNHQICQAAIVSAQTQPSFWGELQSSTEKVSNDVTMTNNDFHLMLFIIVAVRFL